MRITVPDEQALLTLTQEHLLPHLVQQHREPSPLRIWSIGAQVGDEALLLLLRLVCAQGEAAAPRRFTLFATDPDQRAVSRARRLASSDRLQAQASLAPYHHLLEASRNGLALPGALRESLIFGSHDLLRQVPFPHLDLIAYTLPLAYVPEAQQGELLHCLASGLVPQGVLLLLAPDAVLPDTPLFRRHEAAPVSFYERTSAPVGSAHLVGKQWTPPAVLTTRPAPPTLEENPAALLEALQAALEEQLVRNQELEDLLQARRRAEQVEQHLAALVSSSEDAILSKALDGSITSWNAAAERLFGYTEEEIIGQSVSRLFPPDRQDEFTRIMEQIRRGERVDHYETWRVRKDGSRMPVSVTVSPIRDQTGTIIGASDITRDISSRYAAEETRQLLSALVSSSEDAILSKKLDDTITSWNPASERLYGYPAEEIIGQSVTRLYPPDRQEEYTQIMERIRRGERVEPYETMRLRRDGSLVPVSVSISPIRDHTGTIVGASTISRDISARQALERQREAFLSLVSHELKTPLTSLQGNLQLAQRRLTRLLSRTEQMDEEQQRTLEDLLSLLARSQQPLRVQQRLIDDLLDASRLEEGKMELHLAVCDLVELVAQTVQDQQAAHPTRLITLDLPEADPILVSADRDRLQQVLGNYLTNALKFSPETEPVRVGLTLETEAARVWVQDRGPGLSAEQQARIWQQFYQTTETPVQSGWKPGLGLGLYLSQRLIQAQQGQVGVESQPGQGATFWFSLPLHHPTRPQENTPSAS